MPGLPGHLLPLAVVRIVLIINEITTSMGVKSVPIKVLKTVNYN